MGIVNNKEQQMDVSLRQFKFEFTEKSSPEKLDLTVFTAEDIDRGIAKFRRFYPDVHLVLVQDLGEV